MKTTYSHKKCDSLAIKTILNIQNYLKVFVYVLYIIFHIHGSLCFQLEGPKCEKKKRHITFEKMWSTSPNVLD